MSAGIDIFTSLALPTDRYFMVNGRMHMHPVNAMILRVELTFGLNYAQRCTAKELIRMTWRRHKAVPVFEWLVRRVAHLGQPQ